MIHEKVFDPFERILALAILECGTTASSFKISFDGFGSRSMAIKDGNVDINLNFSLKQRIRALSSKKLKGSVIIEHAKGVYSKSFVVENLLITGDDLSKEKSNGTLFSMPVCYPESRFTKTELKASAPVNERIESRPLFCYVIAESRDDSLLIYGPDYRAFEFAEQIGTVTVGTSKIKAYKRIDEQAFVEQEEHQDEVELIDPTKRIDFSITTIIHDGILRVDKPYVLGQDELSTTGKFFTPIDNKIIQSLIALCELIKAGRMRNVVDSIFDGAVLTIDVENGHLSNEIYQIYNIYCAENELIKGIFERIDFTETGVYVRDLNGKTGRLISNSSQSCFAFSLAYYLICSYGGGLASFYNAVKALIASGALYIADDGIITGRTATGEEFSMTYETPAGVRNIKFKRTTYKKVPENLTGVCILGIDRNEDRAKGVPDHYVVAYINEGNGKIIFDPYTTNTVLGQDVSVFESNNDFMLITFVVESKDLAIAGRQGIYA